MRTGETTTDNDQPRVSRSRLTLVVCLVLVAAVLLLPLAVSAYMSTIPSGERTWFWQNPTPQGNGLASASWVAADLGWAVGGGGLVLRSNDGGASWDVLNPGTTHDLHGVFFDSSASGWAVGRNGTIVRTADSGTTWSAHSVPAAQAGRTLRAVSFANANVGVAVGDLGSTTSTIVYTANGGSTWRAASTTCTAALMDVDMITESTGWAVGGNGSILKTTDYGATWELQHQFTTAGFSSVSFSPSGQVGYVVGNAAVPNWTIYKTIDGGATWNAVSGLGTTGAINLFAVDCLDDDIAAVAGSNGQVRRTNGGGASWHNLSINNIGSTILSEFALSPPRS